MSMQKLELPHMLMRCSRSRRITANIEMLQSGFFNKSFQPYFSFLNNYVNITAPITIPVFPHPSLQWITGGISGFSSLLKKIVLIMDCRTNNSSSGGYPQEGQSVQRKCVTDLVSLVTLLFTRIFLFIKFSTSLVDSVHVISKSGQDIPCCGAGGQY